MKYIVLPLVLWCLPSFLAAEEAAMELDPVVVIKTEQPVQSAPVAIDLLEAPQLRLTQTESLEDLQRLVPSLSFGPAALDAKIALRGIRNSSELVTLGADGAVAVHLDEVFLARSQTARMHLFDMERIVLLRGPQSTLYGRNSLAGSINLVTRKPTREQEGYVRAGVGSYDRVFGEMAVSGPLVENKVLARLALYGNKRDGYGRNEFDGSDYEDDETVAGRLGLSFFPSDNMDAHVSAHFQRIDKKNAVYTDGTATGGPVFAQRPPLNGRLAGGLRRVNQNERGVDEREFAGVTLTLNNWLDNDTAVKNISSWQGMDLTNIVDVDDTQVSQMRFEDQQQADQLSHDVQWYSVYDDETALEWIVGVSVFYETMEENALVANPFGPAPIPLIQADAEFETWALATWFELRKQLLPGLRGQVGARLSYDKKSFEESATTLGPRKNDVSDSWTEMPAKAGLSYDLSETLVTFGSVSSGFKSGGYNLNQGPGSKPYDPERVVTYETGIKAVSADRKLRGNIGYFFSDYHDVQLANIEAAFVKVINASDATIHGIEADVDWQVSKGLRLQAAGAWLDATFDDLQQLDVSRPQLGVQDLSGNQLPQAPEFATHLGVEWDLLAHRASEDLLLRVDYSWQDDVFYDQYNRPDVGEQSYGLVDASLTWVKGPWEYQVFGRNLTDEEVASNALVSSSLAGFPVRKFYVGPARYGVAVTRHF